LRAAHPPPLRCAARGRKASKLLFLAFGLATLAYYFPPLFVSAAAAQDYPARPVRIVIGFGPGASGDVAARVLTQSLSGQLGAQFVVENRPGAGSNIATKDASNNSCYDFAVCRGLIV